MSRTWRREIDRRSGTEEREAEPDFRRRAETPDEITPEWAIARIEPHVDFVLSALIDEGTVQPEDKEQFMNVIRIRIWQAVEKFDPAKASILTFLTATVDREAKYVLRLVQRERNRRLACLRLDAIPDDSSALSDRCRSFRQWMFRYDLAVFRNMLRPAEREVLRLRTDGHTILEVTERTGIPRSTVSRYMKKLAEKAVLCGFVPGADDGLGRK